MAKKKYSEVEMIGVLDGGGEECGGGGAGAGSIEAHGVCMEGEVRGMRAGKAQRLR
jgi:hypothetical protein